MFFICVSSLAFFFVASVFVSFVFLSKMIFFFHPSLSSPLFFTPLLPPFSLLFSLLSLFIFLLLSVSFCCSTQHAESLETVQAKRYTTASPTPQPTRSHSERDEMGTCETSGTMNETSETNACGRSKTSAGGRRRRRKLLSLGHQHLSPRIRTRVTITVFWLPHAARDEEDIAQSFTYDGQS